MTDPQRALTALLAGAVLLAAAPGAAAQQPGPGELVDRVMAVVGDSIILASDVEEELLRLAAQGRPVPDDPAQLERLRHQLLDSRINDLVMIQAAERDSVIVEPAEIESMVQREIAERQRAFGGERGLEQALARQGLTMAEYRQVLTREARRSALIERYVMQLRQTRRPPPVTEEEIRAYYEEHRASLEARPASITFRQIVLAPRPSDEARAAARDEALQILERLRAGEDFALLARRHSDDPGSRDRGGELGWFRQGQMVPEFEQVAFRLRPGDTGVAESPFGFHVIRLDRVRGGERQARHILIRPEITEADAARTRDLAYELAERVRAGESVDELAREYGDPSEEVRVGPFPRENLPEAYARELADVREPQVVDPFELPGPGGANRWAVVRVYEVTDEGDYTLDDLRTTVRQQLEFQKLLDEVVAEKRQRIYVDVRA